MLRSCFITRSLLLLAVYGLLRVATVHARDTNCDDAVALRASCNFALTDDPEVLFHCGSGQILAKQFGCYHCVNASTCKHHDYTRVGILPPTAHSSSKHNHVHVAIAATAPAVAASPLPLEGESYEVERSPEMQSAEDNIANEPSLFQVDSDVNIELPFMTDALSTAESAEFNAASVQTGIFSGAAHQEVSNWYFMALAVLAMISLGLAVRSRVLREREERFEKLNSCDAADREDEINPFCCENGVHNPQDDEGDMEFAARYTVDSASDDNEGEHEDEDGVGDVPQDADNDCGFAIVVSSSPNTICS